MTDNEIDDRLRIIASAIEKPADKNLDRQSKEAVTALVGEGLKSLNSIARSLQKLSGTKL